MHSGGILPADIALHAPQHQMPCANFLSACHKHYSIKLMAEARFTKSNKGSSIKCVRVAGSLFHAQLWYLAAMLIWFELFRAAMEAHTQPHATHDLSLNNFNDGNKKYCIRSVNALLIKILRII